MWTKENRARYDCSRLRYPSDRTDEEWALVEPHIPPARRGGNKRTVKLREVVNGLMYILSASCQWRAIPKDLPPRSTLYDYFDLWSWDGTLDRIHGALYVECRQRAEREASPTAAIIDYDRAIALNSDAAMAYYTRGGVYAAKGLFDQAITDETYAIELSPDCTSPCGSMRVKL